MVASALIGALRVSLGLDSALFEQGSKSARGQVNSLERSFESMGQKMQGIGAKMSLAMTAPLVAFGKYSVDAASDAVELQSAFNATFGSLAGQMNAWAEETGNAMGRSTQEMQQGANAFGLYFNQAAKTREEAAKMSQSFTVLAQDLASFHNTSVDDALLALRSGLSGETEPLRRYGVFLNEAAVKAKAMEMGLQPLNGKLTDQQKIMARSAIIMEKTATAQGDVIRTSDSHANRLRASKAAMDELAVTVGSTLVPALTPLVSGLTNLVEKFNTLDSTTQSWIIGIGVGAAALGPLLMGLGSLTQLLAPVAGMLATTASAAIATGGAGGTAAVGLQAFSIGLRAILVSLGPIALAIGAVWLAWKNWDKIEPILRGIWQAFQSTLGPPLKEGIAQIKAALEQLWKGGFGDAVKVVVPVLQQLGTIATQILGALLPGLARGLGSILGSAFKVIAGIITTIIQLVSGDFAGAWKTLDGVFKNVVLAIPRALDAMTNGALSSVARLVDGIRDAIVGRLNAIWDGAKAKIGEVKGAFYNLWDAVVGHSYIPDMVEGIGHWMGKLQQLMVEPGKKATEATRKAFEKLSEDVERLRGIMGSVFPEETRAHELAQDMEFLRQHGERLGLSTEMVAEAMRRMNDELNGTEEKARKAKEAMDELAEQRQQMAEKMQGLMDQAFPEAARARKFAEDLAFIRENAEALGIPMERVQAAVEALTRQFQGLPEVIPVFDLIKRNAEDLGRTINDTLANGLKAMIRGSKSWKDVMLDAIFAIADALINTLFDAINKTDSAGGGGIGGVIGTLFKDVLGGLFAKGGRPPMGKVSVVGEQGPELFVPDTAGRVIPNHALGERQGGGVVRLMVVPSEYFDAKVEEISGGVMMQQAPALVTAAQQSTIRQLNRRRLG